MRTWLAPLALLVAALLAAEVTMQPSTADRVSLLIVFGAVSLVTVGASRAIPVVTARSSSLRSTLFAVALSAVAVTAVALLAAASAMFINAHDLRLAFIAIGFGAGLGIVVGTAVARPLADDLAAVGETARRVGEGDFTPRTGVARPDEVGRAATAVDGMIEQLAAARIERDRAEQARLLFMAAVGHDLRTPLTSMRAAVEALQDGIAPDPARYFDSIEGDLALLESMVEDFFLLARIDAGKIVFDPAPVDLADVADEAVAAMTPVAAVRKVRITLRAEGGILVRGGSRELSRVIRNLLENAIRHAPEASTVEVAVTGGPDGNEVVVTDQGPGFPPRFADVAFEHFSRADAARARSSGGTGLGLAIARGVVEAHGGSIWVGDGPGGRVGFSIPASAA